jgi:hypothetical protein
MFCKLLKFWCLCHKQPRYCVGIAPNFHNFLLLRITSLLLALAYNQLSCHFKCGYIQFGYFSTCENSDDVKIAHVCQASARIYLKNKVKIKHCHMY